MKKLLVSLLLSVGMLNVVASTLTAQPVKVIIPFPPGGGVDATYKNLATFAEKHNIKMIPIYRPGAEGLIGMNELSKSPKDGYTVGVVTTGNIAIYRAKTGDELKPIMGIRNSMSVVVVNPESGIKKLSDFEAELKAGQTINFGIGAPAQKIVATQLSSMMQTARPSLVPYKGGAQVLTDLLGNHITAAVLPINIVESHIDSGKLVPILVIGTTSPFKGVPSTKQIYPKWTDIDWYNFVLPADTDPELQKAWLAFLKTYLTDDNTAKQFKQEFTETVSSDPKQAEDLVRSYIGKMVD